MPAEDEPSYFRIISKTDWGLQTRHEDKSSCLTLGTNVFASFRLMQWSLPIPHPCYLNSKRTHKCVGLKMSCDQTKTEPSEWLISKSKPNGSSVWPLSHCAAYWQLIWPCSRGYTFITRCCSYILCSLCKCCIPASLNSLDDAECWKAKLFLNCTQPLFVRGTECPKWPALLFSVARHSSLTGKSIVDYKVESVSRRT